MLVTHKAQVRVAWRAQEALEGLNYTAEEMVKRHTEENDEYPHTSHRLNGTTVIWVITSADRKTIAVLLPSDSATYRELL